MGLDPKGENSTLFFSEPFPMFYVFFSAKKLLQICDSKPYRKGVGPKTKIALLPTFSDPIDPKMLIFPNIYDDASHTL